MDKITEFLRNNIGFSWKGLLVFLLPMLPNILFFIYEDPNGSKNLSNNHLILDIIENVGRVIFTILLIFIASKKESPMLSAYTILMLIFLLAYYGVWVIYFASGANFIMFMSLAVLPVIYFILAEIWLHNLPAVVPTVIFGAVHIIITYMDCR